MQTDEETEEIWKQKIQKKEMFLSLGFNIFLFYFIETESLCSLGWPQTHDSPAFSPSAVMIGHTTKPSSTGIFYRDILMITECVPLAQL
jgi:hypothetical protein